MADINGFKKYSRALPANQPVEERIQHSKEFVLRANDKLLTEQSTRCMDCGVPFCHSGCPLGNKIPDFNEAVSNSEWKLAYEILTSTNNFPEFTGRICPAPCESACVLGINSDPVAIELIEKTIIEKAFKENWVSPKLDIKRTGKKVIVVGSGPSGLAAADQLNKAGHSVEVYEKNNRIGGLLRYGIPDFKLEKHLIDRRLRVMESEGINFHCNVEVGVDISANSLRNKSDALVLCGGSTVPRDLTIDGRDLEGVYFAMDFLESNNKRIAGDDIDFSKFDLKDKNVVVIGGGDTGSDCIGTARRLGAKSITQLELLAKPNDIRTDKDPWPNWPMTLRTSSSQEEGCDREWSVLSERFIGKKQQLTGLEVIGITWELDKNNRLQMVKNESSRRTIPCDFAFLAIGFVHPQLEGLLKSLDVNLDQRKHIACNNYETSVENVFAAGDARRGQSLVVWAIAEGREAAAAIDKKLMKKDATLNSNSLSALTV